MYANRNIVTIFIGCYGCRLMRLGGWRSWECGGSNCCMLIRLWRWIGRPWSLCILRGAIRGLVWRRSEGLRMGLIDALDALGVMDEVDGLIMQKIQDALTQSALSSIFQHLHQTNAPHDAHLQQHHDHYQHNKTNNSPLWPYRSHSQSLTQLTPTPIWYNT